MKALRLSLLASALLLSCPVIAVEPAPPDGSVALTAEELAGQLKGNTYSYPTGGIGIRRITFQGDVAYARAPGRSGKSKERSGRWQAKGSSFCISFSDGEECHQVRQSGSDLYVKLKAGWEKFKKE